MTKILKFTGKFRDLKPRGYRHTYMYARRYRCWTKWGAEMDQRTADVWIWMKERRVEIQDLYGRSYLIAEWFRGDLCNPDCGFTLNGHYLRPWTRQDSIERQQTFRSAQKVFKGDGSRHIYVMQDTIDEIKRLWADGLIETINTGVAV